MSKNVLVEGHNKKLPVMTVHDKLLAFVALLMTVPLAMAGTVDSNDPFESFMSTVEDWAQGGLGVGLAIASVLIGAARAVGNNNPMSALAGVALAAFIHWGPTVIVDLILDGAII